MNIYRLLLIVLSLISAWLYLRVVLPPEPAAPVIMETTREILPGQGGPQTAAATPEVNAEVPAPAAGETTSQPETTEANSENTAPAAPKVAVPPAELQPLPADQMQQVIETLAPELLERKP